MRSAAILAAVCEVYGCKRADLLDKGSPRARQVAMWLLRRAGFSYPQIGRMLKCAHSTAWHGRARVNQRLNTDPNLALSVRSVDLIIDGGSS